VTGGETDEDREAVATRIIAFIRSLKISDREFARLIGSSPSAVSSYTRGLTLPKFEHLQKMQALGCDLNWLATGTAKSSTDVTNNHTFDEALLRVVVEMIEEWFQRRNAYLPPAKKAELIVEAYALCAEEPADEQAAARIVPRLLRLVA